MSKFQESLAASGQKIEASAEKFFARNPNLGVTVLRDLVAEDTGEHPTFVYQLLTLWVTSKGMISKRGPGGGIKQAENVAA